MDEPAPANTLGRKLTILIVALIVVVAAWTGGWFWLKGEVGRRMDGELAKLAERGIMVDCPDRTIEGWPFRIDIDCDHPVLRQTAQLTTATVKHLRLTSLIYNPTLVVAEIDGPLAATGPNGEIINATWSLLQASLGIALSPSIQPDRLAVAIDGLAAGFARPGGQEVKLTSAHAEAHARPSPDAAPGSVDADLAASLTAATVTIADRPLGPEKADWAASVSARHLPFPLHAGGDPLPRAWAANQGHIDVRSARMGLNGFMLDSEGAVDLLPEGLLNGRLTVTATNIPALMAPGGPTGKTRAELVGLVTAFTIFGKQPQGKPAGARALDLVIDHSQLKMGPTSLGRIPPLY